MSAPGAHFHPSICQPNLASTLYTVSLSTTEDLRARSVSAPGAGAPLTLHLSALSATVSLQVIMYLNQVNNRNKGNWVKKSGLKAKHNKPFFLKNTQSPTSHKLSELCLEFPWSYKSPRIIYENEIQLSDYLGHDVPKQILTYTCSQLSYGLLCLGKV